MKRHFWISSDDFSNVEFIPKMFGLHKCTVFWHSYFVGTELNPILYFANE